MLLSSEVDKLRRLPVVAFGAALGLAACALAACAGLAGIEAPDLVRASGAEDGGAVSSEIAIRPEAIAITTTCAGASETPSLTLENAGTAPAPYELQVPEGSAFALLDESGATTGARTGLVPAKATVSVPLQASATRSGTFPGEVVVRVGGGVRLVPVQVTVQGAELTALPALVDFGEVRQQTEATAQTVELENTGTAAVDVVGFSADGGADFALSLSPTTLAPGAKASATASFAAGDAGLPTSKTFTAITRQAVCGELPRVTVRGVRVNQEVTVNPASIDFGDVDCLSAGGATRSITISNYATVPAVFAVTSGAGSRFSASPSKATVPPATNGIPGAVDVVVTLLPTGSSIGDHAEPLQIDVTTPESRLSTVTAKVRNVGAKLVIEPTRLARYSRDQKKSFTVKNVGNKFVFVRHDSSSPKVFSLVGDSDESALYANAPFPATVEVRLGVSGDHSAEITTTRRDTPGFTFYPASGTICEPPAIVSVTTDN